MTTISRALTSNRAPNTINFQREGRDIEDVLKFRADLSPFLVHLTKTINERSAKHNLYSILESKALKYGDESISEAKYGCNFIDEESRRLYFGAVSFTETPLNEIHCLLQIGGRKTDLAPYGLVFVRKRCMEKGVSPVLYLNNLRGDKNDVVEALCSLIGERPEAASKILPLISFFGRFLTPRVGKAPQRETNEMDFTWEREWRYASDKACFNFDEQDIFIGLCPDAEIHEFEKHFEWLSFVDPKRNMKWYAEKLLGATERSGIKYNMI